MRRRVAEIAPAEGREEIDAAAVGTRRAEARLRDSELFLLVLALGAGIAAGLGVVLIDLLLDLIRHYAFAIPTGGHLSDAAKLAPARLVLVPVGGGLLVGLCSALLRRWRPREVVDAIEANALFGGRMSLGDSLGLVGVTILSGGFGASVGLEAAYTQLGAALASRLGRMVELRRDDMRTLVGCGAAGGHRRGLQCPARRRLLCLRADHRQLYLADPGPGRHRRLDRDPGGARAGRLQSDLCRVARHRLVGIGLSGVFRGRARLGRARHR